MSKIINLIKANPKRSVIAVALTGVVLWVGSFSMGSGRTQVFNGMVNDWKVKYEEGTENNYLIAKRGNVTYECFDTENPNSIDHFAKTPKPLNDKLEKVVYSDSKGQETVLRDYVGNPFMAEERKRLIEKIDSVYNNMRENIREQKRTEATTRLGEITENLK